MPVTRKKRTKSKPRGKANPQTLGTLQIFSGRKKLGQIPLTRTLEVTIKVDLSRPTPHGGSGDPVPISPPKSPTATRNR